MAKKLTNTEAIKNAEKDIVVEKTATKRYKTEKCKVLLYDKKTKELDIDFKGYGIRLNNVDNIESDFVMIKYYGEIGKPNFSCEL